MQDFRSLSIWLLALALLVTCLSLSPRSHQVQQIMYAAQQAATLGEPAEAADYLAQAAERSPWRADLWELAGHYALQAGDDVAALQYLIWAEAKSTDSLSPQGLIDLGDAYLNTGDEQTALEIWQQAAADETVRGQALTRIATTWRDLGDYNAAITALKTLTTHQPENALAFFQLGLLLAIDQEYDSARQAIELSVELDPSLATKASKVRDRILQAQLEDDPAYKPVLLCQALASIEEWVLAAEACRQGIAANPEYAEAWAYLGLAYLQQSAQETPESTSLSSDGRAELEQALALDPTSLTANAFMAMFWAQHGQYHRAVAMMEEAINLAPDRPDWYVDLGELLARSGDLDGAYQAYLQASELAPQNLDYLGHLVDFSLRYNYQTEDIALPVARKLVIAAPEDAAHLDRMAQVMIKRGDLATAERFLMRALQANTSYPPAHLHLGLVYILREDYPTAQQHLLLAISLAPGTPTADQARRLYETYFP